MCSGQLWVLGDSLALGGCCVLALGGLGIRLCDLGGLGCAGCGLFQV